MNEDDVHAAVLALRDWFKSQNILPHESMIVMMLFIARMIRVNRNNYSTEQKLEDIMSDIRKLVEQP